MLMPPAGNRFANMLAPPTSFARTRRASAPRRIISARSVTTADAGNFAGLDRSRAIDSLGRGVCARRPIRVRGPYRAIATEDPRPIVMRLYSWGPPAYSAPLQLI